MPAGHGAGVALVPDPEAVMLLTCFIRGILAGESASAVAAKLNAAGTLTWRDYISRKLGKPLGGKSPKPRQGEKGRVFTRWTTAEVRRQILGRPMFVSPHAPADVVCTGVSRGDMPTIIRSGAVLDADKSV
ncbi:hypothetical protein GT354_16385 [Streptomyces sp. SID3343]|nr:hypothetical protein [Streptomyces sp. SID3343]